MRRDVTVLAEAADPPGPPPGASPRAVGSVWRVRTPGLSWCCGAAVARIVCRIRSRCCWQTFLHHDFSGMVVTNSRCPYADGSEAQNLDNLPPVAMATASPSLGHRAFPIPTWRALRRGPWKTIYLGIMLPLWASIWSRSMPVNCSANEVILTGSSSTASPSCCNGGVAAVSRNSLSIVHRHFLVFLTSDSHDLPAIQAAIERCRPICAIPAIRGRRP